MTRPGDGWDKVGEAMLEEARQFNQKFIDAIRERHAADIWYLDELEALAIKYGVNPAIFRRGSR